MNCLKKVFCLVLATVFLFSISGTSLHAVTFSNQVFPYPYSDSKDQTLSEIKINSIPKINNSEIEFSCEPVSGAYKYYVYFSKDQNFENSKLYYNTSYTSFKFSLMNFEESGQWYAYIVAVDSKSNNIACSKVINFEIPNDYEIFFPDNSLKKAVRKTIEKTGVILKRGVILKSDVEKITELNAPNQGIQALKGIEFLRNLQKLNVQDNLIQYFPSDELSYLKNLSTVDLSNNLIDSNRIENMDLSKISISNLNLSNNCITRMDVSTANNSILKLDLSFNCLTDISDFGNLTNLKSLYLDDNRIMDFSPIKSYYNNLIDKDFILPSDTTTPMPTPTESPITFTDSNLEKEIRDNINRPNGPLYLKDLAFITKLSLSSARIKNLEGIQNLTNLKYLYMPYNLVSNIEPLKNLNKLKFLYLSNNEIENISPLEGLDNLNALFLSDNSESTGGISDITALSKLTKLNILFIDNNSISSLKPIEGAENLCELSAGNNKITDASTLSKNKELTYLYLYDNEISNISGLNNLTYLQCLILAYNPLTSIKTLSMLYNLEELNISSVDISDFSTLSSLSNLTYLNISGNHIKDISFLNYLTNLKSLYFYKNKYKLDYSTIGNLKKISDLHISDNSIENINFLSNLTGLKYLNISGNSIKSIEALNGLLDIEYLNLANNQISDISCLAKLKNLESLYLSFNNIIDYGPMISTYDNLDFKDFNLSDTSVSEFKINSKAITINKGNVPKKVTRAEFASFLVRVLDLKDNTSVPAPYFADVPNDDPYYKDILTVYRLGLLYPNSFNKFEPSMYITRQTYASVIIKALKYNLVKSNYISDISGNSDRQHASTAIAAGLMNFYEDNLFNPNEPMLIDVDAQLIPIVSPANAVNKKVIWTSSNESVATVDSTGFVKGVSSGVAEITATTLDGKFSDKYTVTVNAPTGGQTDPSTEPQTTPSPTTPSSTSPNTGTQPGVGSQSAGVSQSVSTPTPTSTNSNTITPTVTPTSSSTPTATPTSTPDTKIKPSATPIPLAPGSMFKDLNKHWAKAIMEKLASEQIILGYPDGTIKPDSNMTRSEVAVLIAKAIGLKPVNPNLKFMDAGDIPQWAAGYIQAVVDKGIIKGYDDGKFMPKKILTRQELVAMSMNAFGFEAKEAKLTFKDSKTIPNWSRSNISKAVGLKIVTGYNDNTFKPDKAVTRAEVCAIILRCLEMSE